MIKIKSNKDLLDQVLEELFNRRIQSVIIEGGAQLLNTFIDKNIWDEARVFTGEKTFKKGLKSPKISGNSLFTLRIKTDVLNTYLNG